MTPIGKLLIDVDAIAERIERADKYETILESMGLGILETDYNGIVTYLSPVLASWLQDVDFDLVGLPFAPRVHPEDMEETNRCFSEDVPIRQPFFNRYTAEDGEVVYLEWVAAAVSRHNCTAIARRLGRQAWHTRSGGGAGYGR